MVVMLMGYNQGAWAPPFPIQPPSMHWHFVQMSLKSHLIWASSEISESFSSSSAALPICIGWLPGPMYGEDIEFGRDKA